MHFISCMHDTHSTCPISYSSIYSPWISTIPCYFILSQNIFLRTLLSNTLNQCSSLRERLSFAFLQNCKQHYICVFYSFSFY
jgi:hypothetical protein